jgi:hypothetical protein
MVTILRERIVPEFGMYRRISWYTTNRKGYRRRSLALKKEPCAIMGRTTPNALNRRIGFAWVWPGGHPAHADQLNTYHRLGTRFSVPTTVYSSPRL